MALPSCHVLESVGCLLQIKAGYFCSNRYLRLKTALTSKIDCAKILLGGCRRYNSGFIGFLGILLELNGSVYMRLFLCIDRQKIPAISSPNYYQSTP